MKQFDVLILGAGAAGLMCAIEAGKRGRRVAVLEHADRIGKKILISGGGRCNFTNIHCTADNFLSDDPHFAKSALARYTPDDFLELVQAHRIAYHEKKLGQLFCDDSAAQITVMLETECRAASVQVFLNAKLEKVLRSSEEFIVQTAGEEFHAAALVVATGGLSIPRLGATGFGYDLARQFGVKIVTPRPALVPLVFHGTDRKRYSELAGISVEIVARVERQEFREKMLFTHRGLSGPAILQISSHWQAGQEVHIDLAPGLHATAMIRGAKTRQKIVARKALQSFLPNQFAEQWLESHMPDSWTNTALDKLEKQLHDWTVKPVDTEGYEKAEVTAGGIDTRELSSKTMECRNVPGLFYIGEVVDVTGQLGGFNFQWAWASGAAAGRSV
ncbi:MAG TPA: NAD(P)/FAD-dependent oxidoreductase [Candidatus Acidoferrum sp.]|nr:NAD(P)/FAD-dependent oxidoreductase [Candidatus Acidoferrum sp.]